MRWYRKLCLNTTLVAANVLFFGGAIWLLVAGSRVRKAGWLDIFEDDYPWFHTFYVLLVVLLSILIATLAISGLYSVLFQRKAWVLLVYAAACVLTLAFCLFLSIEGGISLSTAHAWKAQPTIDVTKEQHVEANFNQVYCLSQAAFVCTAASNAQWLVHFGSDDVRDLYLDPQVATKVKQAMATERYAAARSFLELCEDESSSLHVPTLSNGLANLCTWCGDIADLRSYVHLVAWANAKCAPSRPTALFCVETVWLNYSNPESTAPPLASPVGVFVTRGQQSSSSSSTGTSRQQPYPSMNDPSSGRQQPVGGGSDPSNRQQSSGREPLAGGTSSPSNALSPVTATPPYVVCRKTFLSYWSTLSLWFLLLSLAMLAFLVVVIRVAWVVLRTKPDRYGTRHGAKPERKPLVQLASRGAGATATTSTTSAAASRPVGTKAAKPSHGQGAVAKAKALFSKGGKSPK